MKLITPDAPRFEFRQTVGVVPFLAVTAQWYPDQWDQPTGDAQGVFYVNDPANCVASTIGITADPGCQVCNTVASSAGNNAGQITIRMAGLSKGTDTYRIQFYVETKMTGDAAKAIATTKVWDAING